MDWRKVVIETVKIMCFVIAESVLRYLYSQGIQTIKGVPIYVLEIVVLVAFGIFILAIRWPFITGQYQKEQEKIKEEQKRDVEALEEQKRSVEALNEKVQRLSKKIEAMKELKTKQLPVTSLTFEQISQNTNAISQAVRRLDKDIEIELKKHKGE